MKTAPSTGDNSNNRYMKRVLSYLKKLEITPTTPNNLIEVHTQLRSHPELNPRKGFEMTRET